MATIRERIHGISEEHEIKKPHLAFGYYHPLDSLTNAQIESWQISTPSGRLLTADDIAKRTGIERRFIANPTRGETTLYMGMAALRSALGFDRPTDALIVSTSYPTGENTAGEINDRLKLGAADLMNVHAACSGFVRGLAYVAENQQHFWGKKIAFVGTELYSPWLEDLRQKGVENDPSLAQTIFSDGAYALVGNYGEDMRVLSYANYKFPDEISGCLRMPIDTTIMRLPYIAEPIPPSPSGKFEQDGKAVFEAVAKGIPPLIRGVVEAAELQSQDITFVIPHQGSGHIVDTLQKRLPEYKVFSDVQDGNFSSASVIKALKRAYEEGKIKQGDIIVLAGFGAGLFASVAVVQFGANIEEMIVNQKKAA